MPYTFEALVDNLQTESANRINEAVALSTNDVRSGKVDKIDFKATHATSSDPASVVSSLSPCAYHLAIGMPQVASSHGVLQCRDLARDSKAGMRVSDSKKSIEKKPRKGGGRGPRPKLADAHSTEQYDPSDEEEEITLHATLSYSRELSSVNHISDSHYDAGRVHFDSCANGCTIRNESLICGPAPTSDRLTRLFGSIPGHLDVRKHGVFAVFGVAPVSQLFQKNILAQNIAEQAGYKVFYDNKDKAYVLTKRGGNNLVFKRDRSSLYSMTVAEFLQCFPRLYAKQTAAHATNTLPSMTRLDLTVSQVRRRDLVVADHRGPLLHLSMHKTLLALKSGTLLNSPYTEFDAINAVETMPCNDCTLARGTRPPATGTFPTPPTAAGQYLAGDIFYVWSKPFLLITDRLTKYKVVVSLTAKTMNAVQGGIRKILDVWKGFKCTPQFLSFDREKSVLALQADLWSSDSLQILAQPPEGHEKLAEREIRTIKEQLYANLVSLPCRLPRSAVIGLITDIVTLQNFVPNNETFPHTPKSILTGERLDIAKWSAFSAGTFGHFYVPYNEGKGHRYELGYILCHENYLPKVLLLPKGVVTVIRDKRYQVVTATTAHYRMLDDLCGGQDKANYEELFQELQEDFGSNADAEEIVPSAPIIRDVTIPASNPQHSAVALIPDVPVAPASAPFVSPEMQQDLTPVHRSLQPSTPLLVQPTSPESPSSAPQIALEEPAPETLTPRREVNFEDDALAMPQPSQARPQRSVTAASRQPGYYRNLARAANSAQSHVKVNNLLLHQVVKQHGEEGPRQAGLAEVRNIIGRETVIPEDGRLLSAAAKSRVLPSFMFYKVKHLNPDEIADLKTKVGNTAYDGTATKLKARWVGGGHRQQPVDKTIVAAPTARPASHNMLLNYAVLKKASITIGDIPAAYLQTKHRSVDGSDTPLHVRMDAATTGLVVEAYPDLATLVMPDGTLVCRVNKALYGLVESAWLWYQECTSTLKSIGYKILDADRGVMRKTLTNGETLVTSVHVDDFMAVSTSPQLEKEFWDTLEKKYPGIKVQRGPHFRHLSYDLFYDKAKSRIEKSQVTYIRSLLKEQGVSGEETLPCRADLLSTSRTSRELTPKEHRAFRSVLQQVAYIDTRPDLLLVCSHLQRFQACPLLQDLEAVWHLLRYLNRQPNLPLIFSPSDGQLRATVDASYASHHDGRSHYGYAIIMGTFTNAPISMKSGGIKTVCRSSTESEITGVNECLSELLWSIDLARELGIAQSNNLIEEDNTSCITLMQREPRNFQTESRHIRVKYEYFRQQYKRGAVHLRHCRTENMASDLFTKQLTGSLFRKHLSTLCNCEVKV